jgi:hypothetical protein
MSEFGSAGSFKDRNTILSLEQRADNLTNVYHDTLPTLLLEGASLDDAFKEIHDTAMGGGYSATGLKGARKHLAKAGYNAEQFIVPTDRYRDRQTADLLGYTTTIQGLQANQLDGMFVVHLPCPEEESIPELMAGISNKFEDLLNEVQTSQDALRLAVWTSQMAFLVHPFYDGNGRACRAAFTYALQCAGQPPIFLENERENRHTRAFTFLSEVSFNMLGRLYAQNMDLLPDFIPSTKNPITPKDLLGIPGMFFREAHKKQRQESVENLLARHISVATMSDIRNLFTDEELDWYRASAQPMPVGCFGIRNHSSEINR